MDAWIFHELKIVPKRLTGPLQPQFLGCNETPTGLLLLIEELFIRTFALSPEQNSYYSFHLQIMTFIGSISELAMCTLSLLIF